METLTLYSDISENFNYNLSIEGANIHNSWTRLCLEFENGENLYFNGKINENGDVVINIPSMMERNNTRGKAKIECVAENTYFELYSVDFEIKRKVNVSLNTNVFESKKEEVETNKPKVKFTFNKTEVEDEIIVPKVNKSENKNSTGIKTFKSVNNR